MHGVYNSKDICYNGNGYGHLLSLNTFYSIFNNLKTTTMKVLFSMKKDILIHILLPIMVIALTVLIFKAEVFDWSLVGCVTPLALATVFLQWAQWTSYPKPFRIKFVCEFIPSIGLSLVVNPHAKGIGILLPCVLLCLEFDDFYTYHKNEVS